MKEDKMTHYCVSCGEKCPWENEEAKKHLLWYECRKCRDKRDSRNAERIKKFLNPENNS